MTFAHSYLGIDGRAPHDRASRFRTVRSNNKLCRLRVHDIVYIACLDNPLIISYSQFVRGHMARCFNDIQAGLGIRLASLLIGTTSRSVSRRSIVYIAKLNTCLASMIVIPSPMTCRLASTEPLDQSMTPMYRYHKKWISHQSSTTPCMYQPLHPSIQE